MKRRGKGKKRKEEDGFRRRLTGRHCSGFDAKDHVIKHGRQVAMNCTHFLANARRRGTVVINTFVKFSRSSNVRCWKLGLRDLDLYHYKCILCEL